MKKLAHKCAQWGIRKAGHMACRNTLTTQNHCRSSGTHSTRIRFEKAKASSQTETVRDSVGRTRTRHGWCSCLGTHFSQTKFAKTLPQAHRNAMSSTGKQSCCMICCVAGRINAASLLPVPRFCDKTVTSRSDSSQQRSQAVQLTGIAVIDLDTKKKFESAQLTECTTSGPA